MALNTLSSYRKCGNMCSVLLFSDGVVVLLFFIFISCISKSVSTGIVPDVENPSLKEKYTVNYSALYDVRTGNSIHDKSQIGSETLTRILFEPAVFSAKAAQTDMKLWTREYLLSFLGSRS